MTTLGEFELHVHSVCTGHNNVQQPDSELPVAPPRAVVLPPYTTYTTDELPQYANPKGVSVSDDKDSIHSSTFDIDEKTMSTSSNRTTSDDVEPETVARKLFPFGFRELKHFVVVFILYVQITHRGGS